MTRSAMLSRAQTRDLLFTEVEVPGLRPGQLGEDS